MTNYQYFLETQAKERDALALKQMRRKIRRQRQELRRLNKLVNCLKGTAHQEYQIKSLREILKESRGLVRQGWAEVNRLRAR